jgi:Holliday junction DNA helicase RuvA
MIGKLTGVFEGRHEDGTLIVDVRGVGYCVRVPGVSGLAEGSPLSLYIHTAVRDDAIDLYGFLQKDELSFFRQLMTVSSVGPKTALSIMSVAEPAALKRTIAQGDAGALHKVFGIGKKSAERIVVELRDKLAAESSGSAASAGGHTDGEVIEALMALGYSAQECRTVIKDIGVDAGTSVKERLGAALRRLGERSTV